MEADKRKWIYWGVAVVVVLIVLAYLMCGDAKAADCPTAVDQTLLAQAKANAAQREADRQRQAGQKKVGDPMDGWSIPLTVGYLAGNPMFGTGLEYTFKNQVALTGQIITTRIEGEDYRVATGYWNRTVPFESPDRNETGFAITVSFPFGN